MQQGSGTARATQFAGRRSWLNAAMYLSESDGPRVSVIGVQDLIIIVDGGDVLITKADSAHGVGTLSQQPSINELLIIAVVAKPDVQSPCDNPATLLIY